MSHLLHPRLGPLREVLVLPAAVAAFVMSVVAARRAGHRPVLWARIPGGVSWARGVPILGDPSVMLLPLARLLRVPVWASSHDISPDHEEDKLMQNSRAGLRSPAQTRQMQRTSRFQAWMQRFGLRRATVVTAVSDGTRTELIRRYSLDPATTGLIRAGVDPLMYADLPAWKLPTCGWRMGYLGAAADTDMELLLRTLHSVAETNPGTSVLLFGRGFGEIDRSLLPASMSLETREAVMYHEMAHVSKSVDIWLVPLGVSGYHGWAWPLKIPMYLASGRPVVITRHPEVVSAGVLPYVFAAEPTPQAGLADGIREVFADPDEASRRAVAAQQFALAELTWDEQFADGLALLDRAVSEP